MRKEGNNAGKITHKKERQRVFNAYMVSLFLFQLVHGMPVFVKWRADKKKTALRFKAVYCLINLW